MQQKNGRDKKGPQNINKWSTSPLLCKDYKYMYNK